MSLNPHAAAKFLLIFGFIFTLGLSLNLGGLVPRAHAAVGLLPGGGDTPSGYVAASDLSAYQCSNVVNLWDAAYSESGYSKTETEMPIEGGGSITLEEMLACGLKSGNMHFWMVPFFVNYALEFLINVAGVLVVLMIVVGGYFYIYGAISEDKDKGKTIIKYALGGYALVLTSWFIVNALLLAVTQ